MGRYRKNSIERKIKGDLVKKFHEQKRITVNEIVEEWFDPRSRYQAIVTERKCRGILNAVCKHFMKQGIPCGCLNENGEFGIPITQEEYLFVVTKRYILTKGIVRNVRVFSTAGRRTGVLRVDSKGFNFPLLKSKDDKNGSD